MYPIVTPRPGKAVRKNALLPDICERLGGRRAWGVVVALAARLADTGQLMPSLKVLGYGLVEQSQLKVVRVVAFGLCTRLPARMRMRLRWACGGGNGAVVALARCLMMLGLYPASPGFDFTLRSRHSLLN